MDMLKFKKINLCNEKIQLYLLYKKEQIDKKNLIFSTSLFICVSRVI